MTGRNSYKELHEKVAWLEVMLSLSDDDEGLVDVLTQIKGINTMLQTYRGNVDGQLTELLAFNENVGA